MEAKPYPIEKRRILAELAENNRKEFFMFFDEIIGTERRKNLSQILPSLKKGGFIKLEMRLKQQTIVFVSNLTRKKEIENPASSAWGTFEKVWALWVQSKSQLNEILLGFDNKSDFDENHKCITPPNSELDIQCFHNLLDESLSSEIDQETIRRFYEYGYFNKDDQIEDLIDKVLPYKEVERRQRLKELPDQVDRLCQEIGELRSQFSDLEFINELEQVLDQQIVEVQQSFKKQFSKLKFSQNVSQIKQSINTLQSRIDELENSLPETQPSINECINSIDTAIAQQLQITNQPIRERLDAMDSAISEIKSMTEEQNQSSVPQIAHKAMEIGRYFETELTAKTERYNNEEKYLDNLKFFQGRYGLTDLTKKDDSEEIAAAVHIAMKVFPVLEIADERMIKIWQLICGNHLHITKINVEMGWFGSQDWFPYLFADECFDERLERIDLDISIREMLETGDMPWAIYLNNCDRSYPESYLPSFLNWIRKICGDSIRVFLTRCSGTNRCDTSSDIYERVARLPKPHKPRPINVRHLGPQYPVTRSDWISWCHSDPNADQGLEKQFEFLDQLQSIIENLEVRFPEKLIPEIIHYLQLSHDILAPIQALDWALTLRLLPWIENQPEVIGSVFDMLDPQNSDLSHFWKELQQASEKANEPN